MDNLFGIPLSSFLIALTLLVILILGFLGRIWLRNPLLVRMGIRNLVRRKTQTILIVIGMMLATLIVSAAFATGDTVGYSITNQVYRDFAGADIVVAFDRERAETGVTDLTDEHVADLRQALADDEAVEGVTGLVQTSAPAINSADRRAEPRATFAGVDPDTIAVFQGLTGQDGEQLDPSILGGDRIYISEFLSEDIGIETGEQLTIFYDDQPYDFLVEGVVADTAITGNIDDAAGQGRVGGLVTSLERWREITGESERIDLIAITAVGGVRDTLDTIGPLEDRVESYIESSGAPMEVVITKADSVELAELIGSVFVTLFIVFGLFSIAAGVMLIFLTFIMLAAERRSEMGMARAVGMKRMHLTETFVSEGMAYNIGAALVGAMLGLVVALGLVSLMGQIIDDDLGFSITFHFNPQGFVIAYFLGLVITFITVGFSSWRAANLNIVEAIRDLPEGGLVRAEERSLSRLSRSIVAVVWSLAWIAMVAIWGVLAFAFFTLGLTTYGLGMLAGGLLAAAYVWGISRVNRSWGSMSWRGRIGYVLWWAGFNIMAFVTWFLFRTRDWAARYRTFGGWAVWMLIIGLLATWWGGWPGDMAFAYTAGTTLVLFSLAMLAVFFGASSRTSYTIASLLVLWYWLLPLPFSLFLDDASGFTDPLGELAALFGLGPEEIEGNIEMFFVSGIAMTSAATVFFIFNAERLVGSLNLLSRVLGGIAPAVRMAISYPLAAKFRTAMTLAMFGLVVFSLVVMATLNSNFTQLFLGEDAKGGFGVRVVANPSNRIEDLRGALAEEGFDVEGELAGVGSLLTGVPEVRTAGTDEEFEEYRLQGVDEGFVNLAEFPLATRAAGYESDEAVMQALLDDPTLAIVDESRTAPEDPFAPSQSDFRLGPTTSELRAEPWQPIPITVRNPDSGETTELRVIGVLEAQVTAVNPTWFALFAHRSAVEEHLDGGDTEVFFLTTQETSKQATVEIASRIEAALLEQGVVATSLQQAIDDAAAQSNAFQYLFEGFMGLGLIVGIAALGVIAFRTVAERRQQIGMMRAIGYTRRMIAMTFFLESSFIALAGIGMGLLLGSALSYNLLSSPELIGEEGTEIDFSFPWVRLLIIVGVAYGASALMTLIPSRSASQVPVAEALRYAG